MAILDRTVLRRLLFGGLVLALPGHAAMVCAATVAVIKSAELPPYDEAVAGLAEALRKADPRLVLVEDTLEGKEDRWADVEARIRKKAPDVVVPVGSLALSLGARNLKDRPVVFTMVLNPEKLVPPGATNVTGVSMNVDAAQQFASIQAGLPNARRIAVLYNPAESGALVEEAKGAASKRGLTLVPVEVRETRSLPEALRSLPGRADALWLIVDRTVLSSKEALEVISLESLRSGIPIVGPSERFTRAGALFSVSVRYRDLGAQTGALVAAILGGRRPADMSVETPRTLEVTYNRKVAEALGVQFPPDFLRGAVEVKR